MGIIIAIALFCAVAATIYRLEARADATLAAYDQPKRAPRPGARDIHTVTCVLGRAAVPSWG
jgi:hypothetical protein